MFLLFLCSYAAGKQLGAEIGHNKHVVRAAGDRLVAAVVVVVVDERFGNVASRHPAGDDRCDDGSVGARRSGRRVYS